MKYLGIDYGKKRVGIAISDENGSLAFPLKILINNPKIIDEIHNLCGEEDISSIVLGESLNSTGKPNRIMEDIQEFKNKLETELRLPVYFQKEFMTTIEARGREGKEINNARKIAKSEQVGADASAAALILQRFLDKNNQR